MYYFHIVDPSLNRKYSVERHPSFFYGCVITIHLLIYTLCFTRKVEFDICLEKNGVKLVPVYNQEPIASVFVCNKEKKVLLLLRDGSF